MKQFDFGFGWGAKDTTVVHFHNKEQWDLDVWPWLCVHVNKTNETTRYFCIDSKGIQIGRKRLDFKSGKVY